jgi:ribose transport system permease protein
VLGVLIFTTLSNVFTLNNLSSSAQAIAKGVIIVLAVLLQQRVAAGNTRQRGLRGSAPDSAGGSIPGSPSGSPTPGAAAGPTN